MSLSTILPGLEHVTPVGDRERHVCVLLDHEHGYPGFVDLLDDLEVLGDQNRRQSHRGLIHQQNLRLRHEGPPHGHHLLFTTGQGPRLLGESLLDAGEHLEHSLVVSIEIVALTEVGADLEVLPHGHPLEETSVLGDHGQPVSDTLCGAPAFTFSPSM